MRFAEVIIIIKNTLNYTIKTMSMNYLFTKIPITK